MKTRMFHHQIPPSQFQGKGAAVPNRAAVCAKLRHMEDELSYFEDVLQQYQYVPYSKMLFEQNERCNRRIAVLKQAVQTLQKRYELLQTVLSNLNKYTTFSDETARKLSADLFAEALRYAREAKTLKREIRSYTDEIDTHRMAPETI